MKIFIPLVLAFTLFSFASADFTSTSFELENPINFMEGGRSSSSSFQYISATGQTTQGQSSSASFGQNAGFLYFPALDEDEEEDTGGGGGVSGSIPAGLIYVGACRIADFNCDKYVNILDLSILLFYLNKTGSKVIPFDLNDDNIINLGDISIMFYHWDR
jgi:hypothetical protein